MTLKRISIMETKRRPGRAALTFLGVAIGVATIVAIPISIENTEAAFGDVFEAASGRASLEVVRRGNAGFDAYIADLARGVAGVESAVGTIQSPAALMGSNGPLPVIALGLSEDTENKVYGLELSEGRLPTAGESACLLEARFAADQGLSHDGVGKIWTPTGLKELRIVGTLNLVGAAMANRGAVVILPLKTAQGLFGLPGEVNSVQVVLDGSAERAQVKNAIQAALPAGFHIQSPSTRGTLARATFLSTRQLLSALSTVSLVAATFVILNTFLMNLTERRHQFAILRSLGLTRTGLTQLLLRESFVLGVAATLVGIPLGLFIAAGFVEVFGESFGARSMDFFVPFGPIAFAAIFGPGLPVLATFIPARRVAAGSILGALFGHRTPKCSGVRVAPVVVGLLLVLLPTSLTFGIVFEWVGPELIPRLVGAAMALGLIGLVLLMQLTVRPMIGFLNVTLSRVLGVETRLALRQLGASLGRTNLTVAVLFVAVTVAVATGATLVTHTNDIRDNLHRIAAGDYFVRSAWPKTTLLLPAPMPETLGDELRAIEGVSSVDTVTWITSRVGDQSLTIAAVSNESDAPLPLDVEQGDPQTMAASLKEGQIVLGTTVAQQLGAHLGTAVPIETTQGIHEFEVAGTATEYTSAGFAAYVDWAVARRLFDFRGVHVFRVNVAASDPVGGARLSAFCSSRELVVHSSEEFKAIVDTMIDAVTGLVWGVIVLAFLVASLGVINTLTMNVLEQTREIGLLRAVGMQRGQVFRLVLSQAGTLAVISLLPGALAGTLMSYAMHVSGEAASGIPVLFSVDVPFLTICTTLTALLALGTAYVPARRAARLRVTEAIGFE